VAKKRKGRVIVAIASDHAGYHLKENLKRALVETGYSVDDMGTYSQGSCDYPDFALKVAEAVSRGEAEKGVLICATGIGMSMVANKVPGVRAAVGNDEYTARFSRLHNDANVLTMGARVLSEEQARGVLDAFMTSEFEGREEAGARHGRRLDKIKEIERRYMKTDKPAG
jgi:ribose 5-phosphate isomerase B